MGTRLELHSELLKFSKNVYFQPPSNLQMTYPCIVYNVAGVTDTYADNSIYSSKKEYQLTVIDRNPDGTLADDIKNHFQYCRISQFYTVDNLNHITLNLHY